MPALVLGPILRYVSETEATIWVQTDAACEVEVLGRRARTFAVGRRHYALVVLRDLEPGSSTEYEVSLDGERRWPELGSPYPPSRIQTLPRPARSGSCGAPAASRARTPAPTYSMSRNIPKGSASTRCTRSRCECSSGRLASGRGCCS